MGIFVVFLVSASLPGIHGFLSWQLSASPARTNPFMNVYSVKACICAHQMTAKHLWRDCGEWRVFIWLKYNDFNVITLPSHIRQSEPHSSTLPAISFPLVQADSGCVWKPYRSRYYLPPLAVWWISPSFLSLTNYTEVFHRIDVFWLEAIFIIPRFLASKMTASSLVFELLAYGLVNFHVLFIQVELFLGS